MYGGEWGITGRSRLRIGKIQIYLTYVGERKKKHEINGEQKNYSNQFRGCVEEGEVTGVWNFVSSKTAGGDVEGVCKRGLERFFSKEVEHFLCVKVGRGKKGKKLNKLS